MVTGNDSYQAVDKMPLDEVARRLADQHLLTTKPSGQPVLLALLTKYEIALKRIYQEWAETSEQDLLLPSAADWLLDNYYLVRQVVNQLKEDLPPNFYLELPVLDEIDVQTGLRARLPRVYVLSRTLVEQVTLQPSLDAVMQFLRAYQTSSSLSMGELWAIPSMLRYVLLEQLAQAAARLTQHPELMFDHSQDIASTRVSGPTAIHGRAESKIPDDDQLVADAFVGLRVVNSTDWLHFFEAVSVVHQVLLQDPSGTYAEMTDDTRDRYRQQVEQLARHGSKSEIEVAKQAVELAQQVTDVDAAQSSNQVKDVSRTRTTHVGYYLVDKGRRQLEAGLEYAPPISWRLRHWAYEHPMSIYFGSIALLAAVALVALMIGTTYAGGAAWQVGIVILLGVVPALTFAVSVVHWLFTLLLPPRILPKLALEEGIPDTARTMVAIPAMLNRVDDVDDLFQQLELHYLRNQDPNGHVTFALLTDFGDAPTATLPDDILLLEHAQASVARLNEEYPGRPFYLFHRKRRWNPSEGVWMGWERKRGKLDEFNRLLRSPVSFGRAKSSEQIIENSFLVAEGDLSILPQVRYVITLDADTVLPRDAARRLVATIIHPLNRAEFDQGTGRVTAGYTVLQPRTETNATNATPSLFTQIFASDAGIDLYTLAVSDVYQDLFGEGSYVGKGIYDVDAFACSMEGRIPENTVLSHDLIEGLHGRAGLVTDIVLFEEYPSHYLINIRRSHRWVRGDWQLLPWLGRRVPDHGGYTANRLPPIARWKIVDNLRRSLLSPMLLLWFVAAWIFLPGAAWVWTLVGVLVPGIPILTTALGMLARAGSKDNHRLSVRPLWKISMRWLLHLAFLPYEALVNAHAIGVTLVRLLITRRNLLQWVTAAHSARLLGANVSVETVTQQIRPSLVLVVPIVLLTIWFSPAAIVAALPLWLLWLSAAGIAHFIGRSTVPVNFVPSQQERQQLRTLARRTWFFYEQFVGPEDNWLPPDHFQESPKGIVAHRTSPTNVGLYLLSVLAAHDLGYIGTANLTLRLRSAFDTLAQLQHYRGHLFNWFDTQNLNTLMPAYVSTVDSGNLAAALVTLKEGCHSLPHQPLLRWEIWQGLLDALALLAGELIADDVYERDAQDAVERALLERALLERAPIDYSERTTLLAVIAVWQKRIADAEGVPESWPALLHWLTGEDRPKLDEAVLVYVETTSESLDAERLQTLRAYGTMLHRQLTNLQYEISLLLPWQLVFLDAPCLFRRDDLPEPAATVWAALRSTLPQAPTLMDAATHYGTLAAEGMRLQVELGEFTTQLSTDVIGTAELAQASAWCQRLVETAQITHLTAQGLVSELAVLAHEAETMVAEMDFAFIFDSRRRLFHIGYNATTGTLDPNYYDLLASEARLASIIAIAKYDVPQNHWLHLGRPFTFIRGRQVLLSWSGTIFEYLMPMLVARSYPGTLLHDSCQSVVTHQRRYAQEFDVPWGISESGFYQFDSAQNYQYRAFGVPELGLKRGLSDELVIAPYASLLAVGLAPAAVLENLTQMQRKGMQGRYGLYEAVDYSAQRLLVGQVKQIVHSYMAHHQGMILLALVNYLQDDRMVDRFHSDVAIQSVELLLQEQIPLAPRIDALAQARKIAPQRARVDAPKTPSWSVPVDSDLPLTHLLANGQMMTMITNSGSGFSRWNRTTLTRWRPDPTLDNWGMWVYLQEMATGAIWSVGRQPLSASLANEEVIFYPHMAEFRHRRYALTVQMQVTVAIDADVEIRRITLTNNGDEPTRLRLTSYGEAVLGDSAGDLRHQAFSKLFIESEYLPKYNALLFSRRPRMSTEHPPLMAHALVAASGERTGAYESDRVRFIGRGRTIRNPIALQSSSWLSGTAGATLDPIMALGEEVEVAAHSTVELALLTLVGPTRVELEELLQRFQSWTAIGKAFAAAEAQALQRVEEQDIRSEDLLLFDLMLSRLLYSHASGRAKAETLSINQLGQPGLWRFGISGDNPILLVRLHQQEQSSLLRKLIQAHRYWRQRGLLVDLVIANEEAGDYGQETQGAVLRSIQRIEAEHFLNQPGGIFIVRQDQMQLTEYTLLQSAALLVLDAELGSVEEQMAVRAATPSRLPNLLTTLPADANTAPRSGLARPQNLQFDNGWGGFSADSSEYVIYLEAGARTPAPWINVIANEGFGFLAGESGSGYSWASNSGENRLTAWRNDPVSDMPAEILYIRDEETGQVWSPTPLPAPDGGPYLVRHGVGYSTYEHTTNGLEQRVRLYGTPDAPVKFVQVRLRNQLSHVRRLTVTFYVEWVLGVERALTAPYILSQYRDGSRAIFATNPYNMEFGDRCAFVATDKPIHGFTTDRTEFFGRNGNYADPAALRRVGLSGQVQPGQDPCAVLQVHIDLLPDAEEEFIFLLGQGEDTAHARELVSAHCTTEAAVEAWAATAANWAEILGTVQVETPEPSMNLLLNQWLLYQTVACRLWGRSALYQSSGAYGFRDQLQDVMALFHTRPDLARSQLLAAARHQFEAGDVLHWWHPPSGRGVRTRISDDLLWLPYVAAQYVATTGDLGVLEEKVPFLQGELLCEDEDERYAEYAEDGERYTLYEHCRRALLKGMTQGKHGLPLMGGGDWNDGMNRVGIKGQGESIWLGWFLYATQMAFADVADAAALPDDAQWLRSHAASLQAALEANGWDGEWYRRAYYDDGTPLGSAQNAECRIDSIAQSWGMLSGAADPKRAQQAMNAVRENLVRQDDRLILLFTPPFNQTRRDPGYIKGYLPGVRENGGQYTHAALWSIWAWAKAGDGNLAHSLFQMINPICRADNPDKAALYQVEPYVISADVYGVPPHVGRGGWSWYTGSSGWMYRLGLEALLGLQRDAQHVWLEPCIPGHWPGFSLQLRVGSTNYHFTVKNPQGVQQGVIAVTLDGIAVATQRIPLVDDGIKHEVTVILGQ